MTSTTKVSLSRQCTDQIAAEVRRCRYCEPNLPHGPRPVIQVDSRAKILIAGQAPGSKVHASGIPFDDASGDRLRSWMDLDKALFYDPEQVANLPLGFCYPGKGKSGDLPPRKECAPLWRQPLLESMPNIQLTIVIGKYAIDWHLSESTKHNLTDTVLNWLESGGKQAIVPMPHPSPRNNVWLKRNLWFEKRFVPALRQKVNTALSRAK
ncbi:MAG: uracil-DNA glycosylase family protein [Gammaproteobacteria bacterium]|nr:uracil-DNA glycosylase family protein [Gammaproteobacteria bacterium]